jgi:tetratricopeptide (TPR) repeat protein
MMYGSRRNAMPADPGSVAQIDANDAFDMGTQFEQRDDLPAAEEAYRAADQQGHAAAAVNLGVLLEERDDLEGAELAFRRADERGDATGAFHLAWLLQEGGDLDGAEDAYRRAELRGHPAAHANLRMMLSERGSAAHADSGNGGGPTNGATPARLAPPPVAPDLSWEAPLGAPAAMAAPPPAPVPVIAPLPAPEPEAPVLETEPPMELEPEVRAEAPTFIEGVEPLATSLAAFQPATEETPAEPAVERDEADALAAAVAASAATSRTGAGRRAPGNSRKERKAQRTQGKARRGGLIARTLAIAIPVAAFAAAFILGAGSRPHLPAASHLAPAANQHGSATVSSVAAVPSPARLSIQHHAAKKAKSKPAHRHATATHGTPASHPAPSTSSAASSPPPATTQSVPPPVNGSGGSAVTTNGTGTTSGSG